MESSGCFCGLLVGVLVGVYGSLWASQSTSTEVWDLSVGLCEAPCGKYFSEISRLSVEISMEGSPCLPLLHVMEGREDVAEGARICCLLFLPGPSVACFCLNKFWNESTYQNLPLGSREILYPTPKGQASSAPGPSPSQVLVPTPTAKTALEATTSHVTQESSRVTYWSCAYSPSFQGPPFPTCWVERGIQKRTCFD